MLIRNSIFYTLAKGLPGIIGIATTALLTRLLDPSQYGVYGVVLVLMTLTSSMAFEWLGISFLRLYDGNRNEPGALATFVVIFLVLVGATAGLALLAWAFTGFDDEGVTICVLGITAAWALSWFELASKVEIANFRPLHYLRLNMVRSALVLFGAVSAAWLTRDPLWTAAGMAAGLFASSLLGALNGERFELRSFNRGLATRVLKFGLPLAMSLILAGLITSGTRVLLAAFASSEALGYYTAAFALMQNSLVVLASGVGTISYQLAVRTADGDDPAVAQRQILDSGTLLLAVLAPAALGIALTADGIAHLLVGPQFAATVAQLTPWMAAAAFLQGIQGGYFDNAFQLGFRSGLQARVTAAAAVVAIGLSLYLIPSMGPLGAAIAVTTASVVSCSLAALLGRWGYPLPPLTGPAARILLACAVMAAVVLMVPGSGALQLAAQITLGGIGYVCTALALNVLDLRSRVLLRRSSRE